MTTLQIVLLSVVGALMLTALVLMIMFLVEMKKASNVEEEEVKNIYVTDEYVYTANEDVSVDDMLAKLEEETAEEVVETPVEEVVEEQVGEVAAENAVEEVEEAPIEELIEEVAEEVVEEVAEEVAEEVVEEQVEEVAEKVEEEIVENQAAHEPIVAGSVIDYTERLKKIIESRDKIDRDLAKVQKSILKYERTERRKNRNQKMLDRRAGELTNLNLVMYSVTDIKNVDEDKKVKQEELTAHIAELKASIQDAEEFIESNKEKNEHNVKMAKFLTREKARYTEEIAELEALIKKADEATDAE